MTTNTNDLKAKWREEDEANRREGVRSLLATPAGRHLFNHLITIAGVYRSASSTESDRLAYDAGRRDIGLELLAICKHADRGAVYTAIAERDAEMSARDRAIFEATNRSKG